MTVFGGSVSPARTIDQTVDFGGTRSTSHRDMHGADSTITTLRRDLVHDGGCSVSARGVSAVDSGPALIGRPPAPQRS